MLGEAVLRLVRPMKRAGEIVLQLHRQLERLARVAEVRLAVTRQLAGVLEWDEVGADEITALLGSDQPERGQHSRHFGHEHGHDSQLVRELARVQRPAPPKATSAKREGS